MKKLFVFLMLLFITGCAGVAVQKFHKELVYPPTKPASIVIFADKPAGNNFTELGEVTVTGAENFSQIEKIFRSKSAQMGADAVYVFSKKEEKSPYVSPSDCYIRQGCYYPYNHFGWHRYRRNYNYPRGYYYCYGYQSTKETTSFISAVGIAIKYLTPAR